LKIRRRRKAAIKIQAKILFPALINLSLLCSVANNNKGEWIMIIQLHTPGKRLLLCWQSWNENA
ncbi:hypothetical protein, partial [Escherichia coli]|uniref:hypothetical protein n=1 Tax=Escherichia coli TaxID=562 RepID=UPI001BDB7F9B